MMNIKYFVPVLGVFILVGCGKQLIDEGGIEVPFVEPIVSEEGVNTTELSPLDTGEEGVSYDGAYQVDVESSVVAWTGRKITGAHNGEVKISSGAFDINDGVGSGTFEIDMTSIQTLDLTGKSAQGMDEHLRNEDFFNVAEHPTATLVLKDIDVVTGGAVELVGALTIKGITNDIAFTATFSGQEGVYTVVSDFSIDRTLWDIRYGSGKFFSDLGDKAIADEMEFSLEIVLDKVK